MTKRTLPLSGYAIEKVYSSYLSLCGKQAEDKGTENKGKDGEVGFGWDWRLLGDDLFEVALLVSVDPSAKRHEAIKVRVVGRFRQVASVPSVKLEDFVALQATSILMPYARQLIGMLTLQSFFGPYHLPPINVAVLMKDFDPSTTQGAKQLTERRSLESGSTIGERKVLSGAPTGRSQAKRK